MTPTQTTSPAITATLSKLPRQQTTVLCPITGYPCEGDIYAKIAVALARGACRHAPMKIYESPRHRPGSTFDDAARSFAAN
jgi:hypothetical protein